MNVARPPLKLLLVEDNAADVELTRETLKSTASRIVMHAVKDGVEALAYLRGEPPYADRPSPDLMMLDLNLPRMDGRELLVELRADPRFRTLPVLVFTTSDAPEDIIQSYQLQANCYITKPLDPDEYTETLRGIELFWCNIARLPNR